MIRGLLAVGLVVVLFTPSAREGVVDAVVPDRLAREAPVTNRTCDRTRRVVVVDLRDRAHRHVLDHAHDAIRAGHPRRLHIDRAAADRHRDEATNGVRTRPGFDRDEYPPAMSREGGRGADVRLVRSRENRSAGASMGAQLERYCDGQRFRFERRVPRVPVEPGNP